MGIIPAYAGSTSAAGVRARGRRDHPRIRGEHSCRQVELADRAGSSPHTRGAHPPTTRRARSERIIPAYAGSTRSSRFGVESCRDHPRIRGEHRETSLHVRLTIGSSPHTRGAPRLGKPHDNHSRIIPAYAGSTSPATTGAEPSQDHPRIRGEHGVPPPLRLLPGGSSPHTRGAPGSGTSPTGSPWDHPRIRGEHADLSRMSDVADVVRGSSPHTRGARSVTPVALRPCRIIPAYAGSTFLSFFVTRGCRDHPRIRGEHLLLAGTDREFEGSSPHTRGALLSGEQFTVGEGIIPAYAGSTVGWSGCRVWSGDHPRIRGEH